MEIVKATKEHKDSIMDLLEQVLEIHQTKRPDLLREGHPKYTEEEMDAILDDEKKPVFVAIEAGKVVAHCMCEIRIHTRNYETGYKELYIDDLCVDSKLRGKGIGKELCGYAKEYAGMIGCHRVALNVWECNEEAMRFYESIGMNVYCRGMEWIID